MAIPRDGAIARDPANSLDGVWRIVSVCAYGWAGNHTPTTHFIIDGTRFLAYDPDLVDGGTYAELQVDWATGRFTHQRDVGSGAKRWRRVNCWLFSLEGGTLRLCWPRVFGAYPEAIDDKRHGVYTCERETGELPACKRASGQAPVDDPELGTLVWSDDRDWWAGSLAAEGGNITLYLIGFARDELDRARDRVRWARDADLAIRAHAAQRLLPIYNQSWGDSTIDHATFCSRLRQNYLTVEHDGRMSVWYDDGGLFRGHAVTVGVGPGGELGEADIAG